MSIDSVMPSNHLILCHPALFLPSIFPSIRVFSNELALHIQSIGAPASASVLPMHIQGWFPLGWTGWISLQSKGLSRVFSNTTFWKHQFFGAQLSLRSNSHIHTWLLQEPYLWPYGPLSAKWCLCFLICCVGWSQLSFQGARDFCWITKFFFSLQKKMNFMRQTPNDCILMCWGEISDDLLGYFSVENSFSVKTPKFSHHPPNFLLHFNPQAQAWREKTGVLSGDVHQAND